MNWVMVLPNSGTSLEDTVPQQMGHHLGAIADAQHRGMPSSKTSLEHKGASWA